MLHFRQSFRRPHHLPQTLVVKLIGESARRFSAKHGAHRNYVIFFRHVLMNNVVGETSERKVSAGEEHFDLIPGRELLDAGEYIGGLFV